MQIERAQKRGVSLLRLTGEFERLCLKDVRPQIEDALATVGPWVVLSMAGVSFIDSSSVAMLLRLRKRAEAEGGDIVLAETSDFVRQILQTLGIESIFQLFETEREALESLGASE